MTPAEPSKAAVLLSNNSILWFRKSFTNWIIFLTNIAKFLLYNSYLWRKAWYLQSHIQFNCWKRENYERNLLKCNTKVKLYITNLSIYALIEFKDNPANIRRVLPKALHLTNSLFAVNVGIHHAHKNLHLRRNLRSVMRWKASEEKHHAGNPKSTLDIWSRNCSTNWKYTGVWSQSEMRAAMSKNSNLMLNSTGCNPINVYQ